MNMPYPDILGFDARIPHRAWRTALAESFALISMASPGDVISIHGPFRVGKSRLVDELVKMLSVGNVFDETGILPVVRVRAVNQGVNGSFATKAFSQRLLVASKHPIYSSREFKIQTKGKRLLYESTSEASYMGAFGEAIVYRKIKFLIIDEAQHVIYVSKGAMAPVAVMDSWKSFAEEHGLVLIIVGTYPVLNVISKSTHMIGRIQRVHFSRYLETEADLEEFIDIIRVYQGIMNVDESIGSLENHFEMLYKGSLGCIGLLRKWLKTASIFAAASNTSVSMDVLRKAATSKADHEFMLREIMEGEHFLQGMFHSKPKQPPPAKNTSPEKEKPKKKGNSKPFQRNPKRMKANNRGELNEQ